MILTANDVRGYIWDRSSADNILSGKLTFSDDEIFDGMKYAARAYNSLPPLSIQVDPNSLPANTNMFLDATVAGLYTFRISQMSRNQIDYNAGGSQVSLEKQQIEYMTKLREWHKKEFETAARTQKAYCNLEGFWGMYDPVHLDGGPNTGWGGL